jgi:phosphoglycolate phosphatase
MNLPAHVIFDLDGTLVHSLPGIQCSAEHAVTAVLPGNSLPDLRPWIGPPVRDVLCAALGDVARGRASDLEKAFRLHYDMMGWRHSECFPGAMEVLGDLCRRRINCYVVTNKPIRPAQDILTYLGMMPCLQAVVAPDSRSPRFKSKTEALGSLINQFGISPESALMVGDSVDDSNAARSCGVRFAAATYGYGAYNRPAAPGLPAPDLALTTLAELSKIMEGFSPRLP